MKKYTIMFLCLSALLVSSVCPGVYGGVRDAEIAVPVRIVDLGERVDTVEKLLKELKQELKKQTKATDELKVMKEEIRGISAPSLTVR